MEEDNITNGSSNKRNLKRSRSSHRSSQIKDTLTDINGSGENSDNSSSSPSRPRKRIVIDTSRRSENNGGKVAINECAEPVSIESNDATSEDNNIWECETSINGTGSQLRRSWRLKGNADNNTKYKESKIKAVDSKNKESFSSDFDVKFSRKRKHKIVKIESENENSSDSFAYQSDYCNNKCTENVNATPSVKPTCETKQKNEKDCMKNKPILIKIEDDSLDSSQILELQDKITTEKASSVELFLQSDNIESYPLFSHCQQLVESSYNFVEDSYEDFYVEKPSWLHIAGITDIKSIDIERYNSKTEVHKNEIRDINVNYSLDENEKLCAQKYNNDLMWTDSVQSLLDIRDIQKESVDELKSWLTVWKNKYAFKQKEISDKISQNSYDSSSDSDSDDSIEDETCKGIIISGLSGSGKNSIISSVANDLGFTILEVNASSCRSGRQINSKLKEAFQSYHVENNKLGDSNKDLFHLESSNKSVCLSSNSATCKREILDKKKNSTAGCVKMSSTCKSIKEFFTGNSKNLIKTSLTEISNKSSTITIKKSPSLKSEKLSIKTSGILATKTSKKTSQINYEEKDIKQMESENLSCKISNLTIIVFDDIDVVFEDNDEGFWCAVNEFLKITKKPVIFTLSRNYNVLQKNIDFDFKMLKLNKTSEANIVKNIQLCLKKNNIQNIEIDLNLLSAHNANDIRKCLLHAQFWAQKNERSTVVSCIESDHNCFLLQYIDFTADAFRNLLFSRSPDLVYILMNHHILGYDLLHCNLFFILNTSNKEVSEAWQSSTNISIRKGGDLSNIILQSETPNDVKKALKKDEHKMLEDFFTLFLEFSYADILKGQFCKNSFKWKSTVERNVKWNKGLPACKDDNYYVSDEIVSEIISLIPMSYIRYHQSTFETLASENIENDIRLTLEYPTGHLSWDSDRGRQLQAILPIVPVAQQLNTSSLNLDYLSALKTMCHFELQRKETNSKRSGRFLHYFDSACILINETDMELISDAYKM